jgi:gamma-glutamylcyclotransferase
MATSDGFMVFAYGSNLDEQQMLWRCPTARFVARARIDGFAIAFAGFSLRWRGAVASLDRRPDERVFGVIYRVSALDLVRLDGFEGCPGVYVRKLTVATSRRGTRFRVHAYMQPSPHEQLVGPSNLYFNTIWRAYERFGFDPRPLFRAVRSLA